MATCIVCKNNPTNYKYCSGCLKIGVVTGTCKKHNTDIVYKGTGFNISVKCELCFIELQERRLQFMETNIEDLYNEFKSKFNIFRKLEMVDTKECQKLIIELEQDKEQPKLIYDKIYSFLNTYPNYKMLSIEHVMMFFTFFSKVETQHITPLCHLIIPCIKNIRSCIDDPQIKFKDRLRYYSCENKRDLFFVWSLCRLTRMLSGSFGDCYVCLDKVTCETEQAPYKVPKYLTNVHICFNCGTHSHSECQQINSCGICRHEFKTIFDGVTIKQNLMLYDLSRPQPYVK